MQSLTMYDPTLKVIMIFYYVEGKIVIWDSMFRETRSTVWESFEEIMNELTEYDVLKLVKE